MCENGVYYFRITIENHYTHSSFKCYDDSQFCNGHRIVTTCKAFGYIISGDYSLEDNLRMIVEARSNVGECIFVVLQVMNLVQQTILIKWVK